MRSRLGDAHMFGRGGSQRRLGRYLWPASFPVKPSLTAPFSRPTEVLPRPPLRRQFGPLGYPPEMPFNKVFEIVLAKLQLRRSELRRFAVYVNGRRPTEQSAKLHALERRNVSFGAKDMIAYDASFAFCADRFGGFFLLSASRLADSCPRWILSYRLPPPTSIYLAAARRQRECRLPPCVLARRRPLPTVQVWICDQA